MMEAAIGVVRISGDEALPIARQVFAGKSMQDHPRMMLYGTILEEQTVLDEVMCVYLPAPRTYTREDMVEIYCHGGKVAIESILKLLLKKGARLAEPGEFTERAFINGRIDLSQAEAVMDMIQAKSEKAYQVSLDHLRGDVHQTVEALREGLLALMAQLILSIDYPEEDEPEITYEALEQGLRKVLGSIEKLLINAEKGKRLIQGITLAIIGKPNVGKSSLLNRLAGHERAIVTPIPGTTRDTIEEHILLEGIPYLLIDTAGLRETEDIIEKLGVERSLQTMKKAMMTLFVLSSDRKLEKEEMELLARLPDKAIVVLNKADQDTVLTTDDLRAYLPEDKIVVTSMLDGQGVDRLEQKIVQESFGMQSDENLPLISNIRQLEELKQAKQSIGDALQGIDDRVAYDYIEVDVRSAYDHLGRLIGKELSGDLLHEVFSRFCVGK